MNKKKMVLSIAAVVCSTLFAQAEVVLSMVNGNMYKHDGTTPVSVNSTLMLLCDADGDGFGDLTQATTSWTADAGDVVLARWGTMNAGSDEVLLSPFNLTGGVDQNDKLMLVWYDKAYSAGDAGPGEGVYFGQFRTDSVISFSDIGWFAPADGTYGLNFATIDAGGDSLESAGAASLQTIPEPTTAVLALIGGGLAYVVRRKQNIWAN